MSLEESIFLAEVMQFVSSLIRGSGLVSARTFKERTPKENSMTNQMEMW